MKKIVFFLVSAFFVFSFSSCNEEDYKGINITHIKEEVNPKSFVGDLTSHIVVSDINGNQIDNIDMGGTFYIIDNSKDAVSSSVWTIKKGDQVITSTNQFERLSFIGPGLVTISLTSTRDSDGKSVTSETTVFINSIPVEASFITKPVEVGGKIKILTSRTVEFTNMSKGSPTIFEWKFEGPETLTSNEENPVMTFMKPGTYNVSFTAKRDDGSEGISENTIVKTGLVVVDQLVVDLIRAVATDSKIELQFTQPITQNILATAASEFSITINTKKGAVLKPSILSIKATGEKTAELSFSDKMYSDDVVLLSFNPTGILKDASGFYLPTKITNEPCVYGYNLWTNTDTEDTSKLKLSTNSSGNGGISFVNENSAQYAMKPYQGRSCIALVRGDGTIGLSVMQGYTVPVGTVVELAYEGKRVGSVGGALERRMSNTMHTGSNDGGGNWSSADSNGGLNTWSTITKQITVGTGTNGKTGELFLTFLRYSGSEDGVLWFDNIRIYIPNPRP